ncbi:potassium-transporting ATPase subunit KdpA [Stenotrophomonas sp. YIM B06876]|uniref:potassium-transporting ATPase subunit KdpA n=1 Tax=Stenotrophomonas sp. YIM B06876 TaxID=3060211 RepID=UPI0027399A5E|nr:potassium-transporting ATPase subunit KdpA [Stenotrophomonas sp. YIM B06876]
MIEMLLIPLATIALAFPLGLYLARVMRGGPMRGDALFGLIEQPLYRLLGVSPAHGMSWRGYAGAFVLNNAVIGVLAMTVFMTQAWLPLNPDQIPNMRWDTALHTTVSFLTNTNQQHYAGQAQLSYLAQMTAITGLQVVTPMMGLALAVATLRALFGARGEAAPPVDAGLPDADRHIAVGNYYVDVIRACVRFMLPLCLLWALLLTSQGVPATLAGGPRATPVDTSAGMATQKIPLGPVAAMVAAKQLGTNGGGWYGPNSAMPLENPTPLSNALELGGILLIPVSVVFMLGAFTGRKRLAGLVFACMLTMSVLSSAATVWLEGHPGRSATLPLLMEGKEVRFGADATALWAAFTTQTSNGSVNGMHDSFSPLGGAVPMVNMLVNAIWGGIGCGLQQFFVYLLLGVFLAGLMTGRTPELFGRKLETPQIRLLALLVLLQPITVLGFTALTLAMPTVAGTSNPGFHGISQVFYEYVSAFANNGSGFAGLGNTTPWWNLSCTAVLLLGRYPALLVPLVVAAQLAGKRRAPESVGTLQIETPTFALTLIALITILTVLQFMPALVLGPVAEHLSLIPHAELRP